MLKKYQWYKIAESLTDTGITENNAVEITAGSKTVCLARYKDKLYGCAQKCPHAGAPMADGWVDEQGNIVCPLHRYKFSLERGRNISGEGYFLKIYPIEERPDGIYIGIDVEIFS